MSPLHLILRGLRFHWRSHLGAVLGTAAACAVITGALMVGDSVRATLRQQADRRLGNVQLAVDTGGRFVTADLAQRMSDELNAPVVAVVHLPATVSLDRSSGDLEAQQSVGAELYGVPPEFNGLEDFFELFVASSRDSTFINQRLSQRLHASVNDTLLVRVQSAGGLAGDVALAPVSASPAAFDVRVVAVRDADRFGNFDLNSKPEPPYNIFVHRASLRGGRVRKGANLILVGRRTDGSVATPDDVTAAIKRHWTLADLGLQFSDIPGAARPVIISDDVIISSSLGDRLLASVPGATGVFTWFFNDITIGDRSTPYGFVSALSAQGADGFGVPADLADDEILLNAWCAADLHAGVGDRVTMSYYVPDRGDKLNVRTSDFIVKAIVPMDSAITTDALMPQYPGLADAENCRDWDTGVPIDLARIRKKDEAYWEKYKGAPKAFVTLATGQRMWSSRFGNLTAVFLPESDQDPQRVTRDALQDLEPAEIGLSVRPVREQAMAAATTGQDFGELFLAFSFFLIAAALLLTGMLFRFGLEQRAAEYGALLAVGIPARTVRRWVVTEAAALCVVGAAIGAPAGVLYTKMILGGLNDAWSDAVAGLELIIDVSPVTVATGAVASAVIGLVTAMIFTRGCRAMPVRRLLVGEAFSGAPVPVSDTSGWKRWGGLCVVGIGAAALIGGLAVDPDDIRAPARFFSIGFLVLFTALVFAAWICRAASRPSRKHLAGSGFALALRNVTRHRWRSVSVVAMLACATFIVIALESQRLDDNDSAMRAGTGGFSLIGETSRPLVFDPDTDAGLEVWGLAREDVGDTRFVSMRVVDGDDASCLNLNRAQSPRLLGVDPEKLAGRTFRFVAALKPDPEASSTASPWTWLARDWGANIVPAVADNNTIVYGLGLKLGDTLDYVDESGRPFKVKLVAALGNSILQGALIINEKDVRERFPSVTGYRQFLISTALQFGTGPEMDNSRAILMDAMEDTGIVVVSALGRLNTLNRVQNTYISIFQVLGALGLVLGSIGLGVLLMRNVLERRSELAIMRALGFTKAILRRMVVGEHAILLLIGVGIGLAAAVVALMPMMQAPGSQMPAMTVGGTVAAVVVNGLVWTVAAAALAMRGDLMSALRKE